MRELPTGTVTLLFTDIEGSTRLLDELGEGYADALAEHRRLLREVFQRHAGVEIDTQGDAFFYAFSKAADAVSAASAGQTALSGGPVRVRMGVHTGEPTVTDEGYVGADVHRAARIMSAGHGGQVLVSKPTRDLLDSTVELRDLGEHRLKDIAGPVWIYQLGSEVFPPLKTIANTNLPRPASTFVGRGRELEDVQALLRQQAVRLLTLTGPGGSGKTRLAIEAAAELVGAYPNGVFWVGLAALRDPALVTETIAQAVGAKDGLAAHIGEREQLLLLDNLEQVIDAAPELAALVESCSNLTLLVTSRELLRVRGEVEYEVPPLVEPEAVELFCARARVAPSDEVEELCLRLDNLPLAVELAAARVKVLSPAQILARLSQRLDLLQGGRDADPRQQTLRATIEWSYALLSEEEQQLFGRLAVFAGGCTLEAAEQVADADLDALQSLVDKSLVLRRDSELGPRYWMLETIREFAAERLDEPGTADELRSRHAEYFLELAQSLGMTYESIESHGGQRHDVATAEQENLRAAIDWAFEQHLELAVRIAVALEGFWVALSPFEGVRRFQTLLERAQGMPLELRAGCHRCLASSTIITSMVEDGIEQYEKSLELYRSVGDERGIAIILNRLGINSWALGDVQRGRSLIEESLARYRAIHFRVGEATALGGLGRVEYTEGNVERGLELIEQSAELARAAGFAFYEAHMLDLLASYALELGRLDDALRHSCGVLVLAHRTGYRQLTVFSLARIASVAVERKDLARAGLLWGAIEAEEARGPIGAWERRRAEVAAPVLAAEGPELERGRVEGRRLTLDEAVASALGSLD